MERYENSIKKLRREQLVMRLQRYGERWSKRKLKYIDSFYRGPMVRRSGRELYNTKYGNEVLPVKK